MNMEKNTLLEIQRVKELMGLKLITEAAAPPARWLDEVLSEVFNINFVKNLDDDTIEDIIRNTIKSTDSDLGENIIQSIVSSVKNGDFTNPLLKQLDVPVLFKNLILKGGSSLKTEIKKTVRDSLKQIYPELNQTAIDMEDLLAQMSTVIKSRPDLYNKGLATLKAFKDQIVGLKGVDKEYKQLLIDAFSLNDLPKEANTLVKKTENKNLLRNTVSDIIQSYEPVGRGSKDIRAGGFTFTPDEFEFIKKFKEGNIEFTQMPQTLQDTIIKELQRNEKFVSKYFDNLMERMGFISTSGKPDIAKFQEFLYEGTKKIKDPNTGEIIDQITSEDLLKSNFTDFDLTIVKGKFDDAIRGVDEITSIAQQFRELPDKTLSQRMNKWLVETALPAFKEISTTELAQGPVYFFQIYLPNLRFNMKNIKLGGISIDDILAKLESEKILLAKNIKDGNPIEQNLKTIQNYSIVLNRSDLSKKTTKQWLEDNLLNSEAFKGSKRLQELIQEPEFQEFIGNLEMNFRKNLSKTIKYMFTDWLNLIPVLNRKLYTKHETFGGGLMDSLTDALKSWGRLITTMDPRSISSMRNIYALAGSKGIWVDRGVKYLIYQLVLFPIIKAMLQGGTKNEMAVQAIGEYRNAKDLLCFPQVVDGTTVPPVATEEDCSKLDEIIKNLEQKPTRWELTNQLRSYNPLGILGIPVEVYADDVYFWFDSFFYEVVEGKGLLQMGKDNLKGLVSLFTGKIDAAQNQNLKILQNEYGYVEKDGKTAEDNMLTFMVNKRRLRQGEREAQSGPVQYEESQSANWASAQGYEIVVPYNSLDGTITVKKPDSTTQIYYWSKDDKTWEP